MFETGCLWEFMLVVQRPHDVAIPERPNRTLTAGSFRVSLCTEGCWGLLCRRSGRTHVDCDMALPLLPAFGGNSLQLASGVACICEFIEAFALMDGHLCEARVDASVAG